MKDAEHIFEDDSAILATPEQSAIWLFDKIWGASATYNISVAYRFDEHLDISRLDEAFRALLFRHQVLLTRFFIERGQLVQKICDGNLPRLRRWPADGYLEQDSINSYLDREIREHIDLSSNDDLIRLTLLRNAEHDVLCLTIHHIISDERSVQILLRDLAKGYRGELGFTPAFLQSQRRRPAPALMPKLRRHVSSVLSDGLSGTGYQIFTATPDESQACVSAMKRRYIFNSTLSMALAGLAGWFEAPRHLIVLTALTHALAEVSGCHDFAILTPVTQRGTSEEWGAVGLNLKFLPLRCVIDRQDRFHQTLKGLRKRLFELIDHGADFSWQQVDDAIVQRRSLALGTALEVMYTATEEQEDFLEIAGLRGERLYLDNGTAKTLFACMVSTSERGLAMTFQWKSEYIAENKIQEIWTRLTQRIDVEWHAYQRQT